MISAADFARQAETGGYIGIPYKTLDCQAFIERVLKDVGVVDESGRAYNWRGSNHIWRDAVNTRTENDLNPPIGAVVFTIKNDGGERKRGYKDDMKNAAHIGIYVGNNRVIHSTTGGVQWDVIASSRWTHYARMSCLEY